MGQGGKQAKTNVFANLKYIFGVLSVKYFKLHLNRSKLFFSVSTPCLPLVAEAGALRHPRQVIIMEGQVWAAE